MCMYMGVKINMFVNLYCVYNLIYSYSRNKIIGNDIKINDV